VSLSSPRLGRPVDADGDATRSRVLRAARTAFAELGYAATTYRLLAERTGLAPSALYNYFSSKAELFAAVHAEVQLETYSEWIVPAISDTATFAARIDALLESFVDMNAEAPEAARFQAAARIDTVRHAELAAVRDSLPTQRRTMFADMVDLGISTGELAEDDRTGVQAMLETITAGLVELAVDPDQHRVAVAAFRHAIASMLKAKKDQL
jgi:AcrR family transcriptional regulator